MKPELSLYVHIPWCVKKCPYCDFNSHTLPDVSIDTQGYLTALKKDIEAQLERFRIWADLESRQLVSIFIGGGTPSVMPPEFYQGLLAFIEQHFNFKSATDIEITLEANPGKLDQGYLAGYRAVGINRLSLGVQSFQPKHLNRLGRIHNEYQAFEGIETALKVGFENLNVDLMMGLPEQTLESVVYDLECALQYPLTHLSWYQLTIEPNTPFYHTRPPVPDDDVVMDWYQAGQRLLAEKGFLPYEVSAYAHASLNQTSAVCAHNLQYWRFGDYLGIGAGAHGKLTAADQQQIIRTRQHKMPTAYQQQVVSPHVVSSVAITDIPFEYALNVWRLSEPFSEEAFVQTTGLSAQVIESPIKQALALGLIEAVEPTFYRKTALGSRFVNDLIELFFAEGHC